MTRSSTPRAPAVDARPLSLLASPASKLPSIRLPRRRRCCVAQERTWATRFAGAAFDLPTSICRPSSAGHGRRPAAGAVRREDGAPAPARRSSPWPRMTPAARWLAFQVLDAAQRLPEQRHVEPDGHRVRQPIINAGAARPELHQRGRRRRYDSAAQEHLPGCGCCRSRGGSGNGRAKPTPGPRCWPKRAGRTLPVRSSIRTRPTSTRHPTWWIRSAPLPAHGASRSRRRWAKSCAAAWRAWRCVIAGWSNALEDLLTSVRRHPRPRLIHPRCGRRQPESPAQPIHRGRVRAHRRHRPSRGRGAGRDDDAGRGDRSPCQSLPRDAPPLPRPCPRNALSHAPPPAGMMRMSGFCGCWYE
jgi:hypothetical protein